MTDTTDKWQPIETAPKDVPVILYSPDFRTPVVGKWGHYCKYNHPNFTRWMPLPAPPKD